MARLTRRTCHHNIDLWLNCMTVRDGSSFMVRKPMMLCCALCLQQESLPKTWQFGINDMFRLQ
jgi:hypothetical protein